MKSCMMICYIEIIQTMKIKFEIVEVIKIDSTRIIHWLYYYFQCQVNYKQNKTKLNILCSTFEEKYCLNKWFQWCNHKKFKHNVVSGITYRRRTGRTHISSRCCLWWETFNMGDQAMCVHKIWKKREMISDQVEFLRISRHICERELTQATQSSSLINSGIQRSIAQCASRWPIILPINYPIRIFFHL